MEAGVVTTQTGVVEWLMIILLGGVMGAIGQGIRVVIGIKKLHEDMAKDGKTLGDGFRGTTLVVSLLIGFIAGALAAITLVEGDKVERELLMGLLAAGYAGTDFIEGFMRKYLPGSRTAANGGDGSAPKGPVKPAGQPPADANPCLPATG